ncbi:MAG TPA: hypothetical protein VLB45_03415 [Nitrosopumilaceae archaeon]|nr:hypothetical protein [Nitrosopumilaceae archaeon]
MKYLFIFLIGFSVFVVCNVHAETIPSWIKQTAGLWAEKKIDDSKFIQSLEHLTKDGILQIKIEHDSTNVYILPKYGQTSLVTISGTTGDFKKRNNVILIILQPDGKTIDLTAAVLESGIYQTTLVLNHDSPVGLYTITGMFSGSPIQESSFYVKQSSSPKIPSWIKNNARWWADGKISDNDFVLGIQYLIDSKIMIVDFQNPNMQNHLQIYVQGKEQVRRGTMQSINVHVTDGENPLSGATVQIRVEDYGENLFKEFQGITDSKGEYFFSWEIDKNADAETLLVFVDVTDGFSSTSQMFSFQVICLCGEPNCECR